MSIGPVARGSGGRRHRPLGGLDLGPAPSPGGDYSAVIVIDGLAFVSGQVPLSGGRLVAEGRVGGEVQVEDARACARQCARNALSQLRDRVGGSSSLCHLVKLTVMVAVAPGFHDVGHIADAASQTLRDLLGPLGAHARTTFGVSSLPRNSPVELEMVAAVRP